MCDVYVDVSKINSFLIFNNLRINRFLVMFGNIVIRSFFYSNIVRIFLVMFDYDIMTCRALVIDFYFKCDSCFVLTPP